MSYNKAGLYLKVMITGLCHVLHDSIVKGSCWLLSSASIYYSTLVSLLVQTPKDK